MITITFHGHYTKAQITLRGVVTDAVTNEPIDAAMIQLLRGSDERLVNYTLSDPQGWFSFPSGKQTDSLQIAVSLLGYKPQKMSINSGETVKFRMEQEVFSLREVEIRPGRVWGRQDTLNYDVAQFLSAKDQTIKDVIRKLPGIDVDEIGRISYNGKSISNLYVEGLDVTDGKYNRINNNLQAESVETVQVLENHQPIRLLKEKVKVEDVAINLKLKPEFRDKWMLSVRGATGFSPDNFLWEGALDALQLSRKSQSIYLYKGNNTGKDVTDEQLMLIEKSYTRIKERDILSFLSQPSLDAPLKKERWLFNDVHTLSANRLRKLNETTQLRINAGYTHDRQKQTRGSETTYFQQNDTLHMVEQSNSQIRSDMGEVSLNIENNSPERYLTNHMNVYGERKSSLSRFRNDRSFDQQIKTTDIGLQNNLRSLWNKDKYTMEIHSIVRYNHSPGKLYVEHTEQSMNLNHFYTDNSFSVFRKKGYVSHRYTAGIIGQVSNIKDGLSAYLTPNWQITNGKWQGNLSVPVVWTGFPATDFSRLAANPSLYIQYKLNYAWRFTVYGNYREQYGDITDLYDKPYQTDYRHIIRTNGILPIQRHQNYSIYSEYKNTVREFFGSLSLSHNRSWSSRIFEQLFEEDQVILISRELSNKATGWTMKGTLSKGFYDWKMKASLNYLLSTQKAERLSEGKRMPFQSNYMQYEPKLSWSPHIRWEVGYEGFFRYGGYKIGENTRLSSLWNIDHKVNLSYILFPIEINTSVDHYYNDVSKDKSIHAFFADASIRWKNGSWQIDASVNNLFDKKQYSYTRYSSLESYTSWVNIRGREFLLSARYRF